MDAEAAAREEKLLAAKKKLKSYQKKKAGGGGSKDATSPTTTTRRTSADSAVTSRKSSVASETSSVPTDATVESSKNSESHEEKISVTAASPGLSDVKEDGQVAVTVVTQKSTVDATTGINIDGTLVEAHQPTSEPHGHQQQKIGISVPTIADATLYQKTGLANAEEPVTFEYLANLCHAQEQTIAVLVGEKQQLATELEKYSVMVDRFKSSEQLLEEGQLIVDGLRRKNAELEEKIKVGEEKLQESVEENKKTLESLRLEKARAEKLERDSNQLTSQLSTKDSIIEQLVEEKATIHSTSEEVEKLTKSLQDKEDRCEALEIELSNLRHRVSTTDQQLSEKEEKLTAAERVSNETGSKFQELSAQISTLTEENNQLRQSFEDLQLQHQAKSNEATEYYEQLTVKSNLSQKFHSEWESASKELQAVQAENTKLTKRIKDITTKVDSLLTENNDLISQLTELRARVVEISNDKLALTEELDREKSKTTKFEQEVTKYRETWQSQQNDVAAASSSGATTEASEAPSDVYQKQYNDLSQLLYAERQKSQDLEYQLSRLQAAYNAVLMQGTEIIAPPPSVDSTYTTEAFPPEETSTVPFATTSTEAASTSRYPISQHSITDFEIGRCSGCMGEVIIV